MQITPASASDISALCELLDILFSQEADFKPDHEAQSRGLARIISSPEVGLIIVARQDSQVVGMVNLLYTEYLLRSATELRYWKIWWYPPTLAALAWALGS